MNSAGIIAAGWGERLGQKIPKALTQVAGKALIDYTLDGFEAAGIQRVTCIVNEAARAVPEHVAKSSRKLEMDWIIQTTPSSMHSFLIVLERLANSPSPGLRPPSPLSRERDIISPSPYLRETGASSISYSAPVPVRYGKGSGDEGEQESFFITTVDSICPPSAYADFIATSDLFRNADVSLGVTTFVDDEKPLRVAMRGEEGTGLMPERVKDNPEAFEIVAMTSHGFASEYVTAGFYRANPRILKEKEMVLSRKFTALRQCLGYLLKYGYRFYGVPLPAVVDVDRPQDIQTAERFIQETTCS